MIWSLLGWDHQKLKYWIRLNWIHSTLTEMIHGSPLIDEPFLFNLGYSLNCAILWTRDVLSIDISVLSFLLMFIWKEQHFSEWTAINCTRKFSSKSDSIRMYLHSSYLHLGHVSMYPLRLFAHYITPLSSLCRLIWRYWTSTMLDRFILLSVCLRWSHTSRLTIYGLCVFSLPIYLMMNVRIRVLYLIIISKSEVWAIRHCLRLGHETMVCTVCLSIFLRPFCKYEDSHVKGKTVARLSYL